ncbi:hypothetical protein [uncultured Rikenella sp.]|uniref:hypothetical protein n=1 Tax=uncultured Rikenella sp. TaxID=368003 RepID=UPI0025D3EE99|nr:hypothetical protein [uncultured Rikenella sp.]
MADFFKKSEFLEYLVTRPLSHIRPNWELSWDENINSYQHEEDSYAEELNNLIKEIGQTPVPVSYHEHEDHLAEYVKNNHNWPIYKVRNRWICDDYRSIIDQGCFSPEGIQNLLQAIAGRVDATKKLGQMHFDEMESGHQRILGFAITTILYQRSIGQCTPLCTRRFLFRPKSSLSKAL